jgi:SSS family solute:Na+ symporter
MIVGMLYGRKTSTVKDYLVGSKNFSVAVLLMTICATWLTGEGVLGTATEVYISGLNYIIPSVLSSPASFLIMSLMAPKVAKFSRAYTVGDVMHAMFGMPGKIATGVLGLVLSIGFVSAQVKCMGYISEYFFDSKMLGIIVGGGAVVLYTTMGGIKSVAFTDVVQFLVLIVAIPLVYSITLGSVGGYSGLLAKLPADYFVIPTSEIITDLCIFIVLGIPFLDPAMSQRMLMNGPGFGIRKPFKILVFVMPALYFFAAITGAVVFVCYPGIVPNLAYPVMIDYGLPCGVKGLAIAGVFAVLMSTADSYVNVAASSLMYDTFGVMINSKFYQRHKLQMLKLSSFVIGGLALLVATLNLRVVELIINFCGFWGPVVVIPLYAGLFGFVTTPLSFVVGGVVGLFVTACIKLFASDMSFWISIPISMAANGLAFFITHHIQRYFFTFDFVRKVNERKDAIAEAQGVIRS